MSVESTRATITRYIDSAHTDRTVMSDGVVFKNMATGEEYHGPDGVAQMLNYIYHVAFDATAEVRNTIFADGKAMMEADFVGTHIGDFFGIAPTNKQVRVPLCVVYDLANDRITRARIYLETPVLLQQLGVSS
jgi:Predicted ester cyclase